MLCFVLFIFFSFAVHSALRLECLIVKWMNINTRCGVHGMVLVDHNIFFLYWFECCSYIYDKKIEMPNQYKTIIQSKMILKFRSCRSYRTVYDNWNDIGIAFDVVRVHYNVVDQRLPPAINWSHWHCIKLNWISVAIEINVLIAVANCTASECVCVIYIL